VKELVETVALALGDATGSVAVAKPKKGTRRRSI